MRIFVATSLLLAGCQTSYQCEVLPAEEIGWDDAIGDLSSPAELADGTRDDLDGLNLRLISELRPDAGPVTLDVVRGSDPPLFFDVEETSRKRIGWRSESVFIQEAPCVPSVHAPVEVTVHVGEDAPDTVTGPIIEGRFQAGFSDRAFYQTTTEGAAEWVAAAEDAGHSGEVTTLILIDETSADVQWFDGFNTGSHVQLGSAFEPIPE